MRSREIETKSKQNHKLSRTVVRSRGDADQTSCYVVHVGANREAFVSERDVVESDRDAIASSYDVLVSSTLEDVTPDRDANALGRFTVNTARACVPVPYVDHAIVSAR